MSLRPVTKTERIAWRLTPEAKALIQRLAVAKGISQADVLELAVRALAKKEGIR